MERLMVLRGKSMPSLYSWSCKRSYKNGYVWNDLAENDIIYPADGAEFVLKGSELLDACPVSTDRIQQTHVNNKQVIIHDQTNFQSKPKQQQLASRRGHNNSTKYEEFYEDDDEEQQEEEEEYYEDEEIKTSYTSSTDHQPHSHCSRGVSTDELESSSTQKIVSTTTESATHSDSSITSTIQTNSKNTSKRFEDGEPTPGRNSVLLQLIACGGNLAMSKAKSTAPVTNNKEIMNNDVDNKNVVTIKKSNNYDLHKGVLCKSALNRKVVVVEEEDMMISCMSENPRFGNFQAEEKEYFSGSIVESMSQEDRVVAQQPMLKKSNSYNEERSNKVGLGVEIIETEDEDEKKEKRAKGKCIPRKKSSSASKQTKKI
ncbi:hypothetical protein ACFE04_016935 [Oxalis oulophora]